MTLVVSLRIQDIQVRKEKYRLRRRERVNIIEAKKDRSERLLRELYDAREEADENFNEDEWVEIWNHNNPDTEVPDEPVKEVNADFEDMEQEDTEEAENQEEQGLDKNGGKGTGSMLELND